MNCIVCDKDKFRIKHHENDGEEDKYFVICESCDATIIKKDIFYIPVTKPRLALGHITEVSVACDSVEIYHRGANKAKLPPTLKPMMMKG